MVKEDRRPFLPRRQGGSTETASAGAPDSRSIGSRPWRDRQRRACYARAQGGRSMTARRVYLLGVATFFTLALLWILLR